VEKVSEKVSGLFVSSKNKPDTFFMIGHQAVPIYLYGQCVLRLPEIVQIVPADFGLHEDRLAIVSTLHNV
jgi:hypothetical protein